MNYNLVFGSTGLVGTAFFKIIKNKKKYKFFSRSKAKGIYKWNFNKNIKKFKYQNINNCYFFSSPRILKENFEKDKFKDEFLWLKNIIQNFKIRKIIYLSSSTVNYKYRNSIGKTKKKCEKLLLKNKKKFSSIQIWRPYNLIGYNNKFSDHFHSLLFKSIFIQKKFNLNFSGNKNDERAYSDVKQFVEIMLKHSKRPTSFIKEYGSNDRIKMKEIVDLYNFFSKKIFNKKIRVIFRSKYKNTNIIKKNNNSIIVKNNSKKLIKKFLINNLQKLKLVDFI